MQTRVATASTPGLETPVLRLAYGAALVLVLAPFAISAIATAAHDTVFPISDRALIELGVRDIGVHSVTVGLASRDGWFHPGPILFYLLAPLYRVLGSDMNALYVGTSIINGGVVVAMAAVGRRIAGIPFALLLLTGTSIVIRALGADFVRDPWVLYVTVLPFGLFCLLVWAMTTGRIWALPATAAVATFLAQTHVGYLAIAAPGCVLGGVWLAFAVHRERGARVRTLRNAGLATVALLAVLWAPTLWDQLFGSGNLATIMWWFRDAKGGTHSLAEGARVMFAQLAVVPDWITGTRHVGLFTTETTLTASAPAPLGVIAFAAAAVIAWRRRDRLAGRLLLVLGVMLAVGVIANARTVGPVYDYRLQWTWMLGALIAVAVAWTAWRPLADRRPGAIRLLVPVVLLGLSALTVTETVDALRADHSPEAISPFPATAAAEAASTLEPNGGVVVVASETSVGQWKLYGVVVALEHLGFDVRVRNDTFNVYGAHRSWDRRRPQAELVLLEGQDLARARSRRGWKLVGYGGPTSLARDLRVVRETATVQRRLVESYQHHEISRQDLETRTRRLTTPAADAVALLQRLGGGETTTSELRDRPAGPTANNGGAPDPGTKPGPVHRLVR